MRQNRYAARAPLNACFSDPQICSQWSNFSLLANWPPEAWLRQAQRGECAHTMRGALLSRIKRTSVSMAGRLALSSYTMDYDDEAYALSGLRRRVCTGKG